MRRFVITIATAAFVSACNADGADTYTLYRNSPLDHAERVHWSTFDAKDKGDYNQANCGMAARLLNANVEASAKAEAKEPFDGVGFWCERGKYSEKGIIPAEFDAAFPAQSDSPLSW